MKKLDLSKLNVQTLRALSKSETVEDFLKFVEKYDVDLGEDEARDIFNIMKVDIEQLTEEQLEMVSGGLGTGVPSSNSQPSS